MEAIQYGVDKATDKLLPEEYHWAKIPISLVAALIGGRLSERAVTSASRGLVRAAKKVRLRRVPGTRAKGPAQVEIVGDIPSDSEVIRQIETVPPHYAEEAGKAAEQMRRVSGRKFGGEPYTDFLIGEGDGSGFAARLEDDTLSLDWHGGVGNLKPRLQQVKALAEGAQINTIKGHASGNLKDIIEGKVRGQSFDKSRWSRGMGETFGGKWTTTVTREPGINGKWWIVSKRAPTP
jgi:hypothetical protein